MICCVLLWFNIGQFDHILQDYFTGTGAIKWLPQCHWINLEEYWKIFHKPICHNLAQSSGKTDSRLWDRTVLALEVLFDEVGIYLKNYIIVAAEAMAPCVTRPSIIMALTCGTKCFFSSMGKNVNNPLRWYSTRRTAEYWTRQDKTNSNLRMAKILKTKINLYIPLKWFSKQNVKKAFSFPIMEAVMCLLYLGFLYPFHKSPQKSVCQ